MLRDEDRRISRRSEGARLLEDLEKGRVSDHTGLDGFEQSATDLARIEAGENLDIGHHASGRMERCHQVLPFGNIHTDLSSNTAVDLGKERGRHMDELDSPHIDRGDESGSVPANSPSHSDQS